MYNHTDTPAEKTEIASLWLLLFFLVLCIAGLVGLSLWSYNQTQIFFTSLDDPNWTLLGIPLVSHFMTLVFQYGQNPAFWFFLFYMRKFQAHRDAGMPDRSHALDSAWVSLCIFLVLAAVDAGTNVAEVLKHDMNMWQTAIFIAVSMCVVFVEEMLMKVLVVFFVVLQDIGKLGGLHMGFARRASRFLDAKPTPTWAQSPFPQNE